MVVINKIKDAFIKTGYAKAASAKAADLVVRTAFPHNVTQFLIRHRPDVSKRNKFLPILRVRLSLKDVSVLPSKLPITRGGHHLIPLLTTARFS